MQKERLLKLLQQFIAGTIESPEMSELSAYVRQEGNKEAVIDAFAILLEKNAESGLFDEKRFTPLLNAIFEADRSDKEVEKEKRHAGVFWLSRWIAAAVLIAALLITGIYFWQGPAHKNKPAVKQLARDVPAPHSVNALLTLANGVRIALDSMENGSRTMQGNTEVVKLDDGQLAYHATDQHTGGAEEQEPGYNTLTVPRGSKIVTIQLADGTKVWLNSESSLKYPVRFSGNERKVEITGEVYFEVAPLTPKGGYKKIPFKVYAAPPSGGGGGMEVEVLGTHFNINAYDDEPATKTTLLEGSVKLSTVNPQLSTVLKPGQQAQVNQDGEIALQQDVDIDEVMAWKEGKFRFKNADIRIIMRQIGRWYNVDIVYQGDIPRGGLSGFMPRAKNASELLDAFEATGVVHFQIEDKRIIVLPGHG